MSPAYTSVIAVHRLEGAVEYTLNEKKSTRSKNEENLRSILGETMNQDRTEQDLFQSALGCTLETPFEDMLHIKKRWHKLGGVEGYHLVQSFAPGEVTPELAHQIGLELAERLLGVQFQTVVSTHLNTRCIHNHIVWNSVSLANGRKYRSNEKSYYTQVRHFSDELCEKYGLSIIYPGRTGQPGRPYAQWLAEREGKPTWKTPLQQDVNEAISLSLTWRQFLREMEGRGYTFRFDRRYPTLTPPGRQRPVKLKTLGWQYTPESIRRRILTPKRYPTGKNRRYRLRGELPPSLKGLRALYYSYLYKMGAFPRKPRRPSYAVREDIRNLDKRIQQMAFVFQNHIENREQLREMQAAAKRQIQELVTQRRKLNRADPGSWEIEVLNQKLRPLRKTVRLCKAVEEHSLQMEERLRQSPQREERKLKEIRKERER